MDQILLRGCYPRIHLDRLDPAKTYSSYVRTYLERDVRTILHVQNLALFQKFIVLCASRIGQILNREGLANEVGISAKTVEHWLSILEACYVIYRLQPYYQSFGKRVVKAPKIYFCDVGLVSYLLGIESVEQLTRDPMRSHIFENLIVNELMKARYNRGHDPRLYFYQVAGRSEVDLIFQRGHQLIPIEIKSSMTFNSSFLDGIRRFQKIASDSAAEGYVIYSGSEELAFEGVRLLNFQRTAEIVLE